MPNAPIAAECRRDQAGEDPGGRADQLAQMLIDVLEAARSRATRWLDRDHDRRTARSGVSNLASG